MQTYDNEGRLINEIVTRVTSEGELIISSTKYGYWGEVAFQNVSVRRTDGSVQTTNILGGKVLP